VKKGLAHDKLTLPSKIPLLYILSPT